MRAFFCIPIGGSVRFSIAGISEALRARCPIRASWVPTSNFHVTLRFLGEIEPALTPQLEGIAQMACESVSPFDYILDRVGAFPTPERARVVWVGGDAPGSLKALCQRLSQGLSDLGFAADRPQLLTHITIARIKQHPPSDLPSILASLSPPGPLRARADAIQLVESHLTPRGAMYTPLFTRRLAGTNRDAH